MPGRVLLRCRFPACCGRVGIHFGEAIANVHLDANGASLVASITVEAVRQLGLTEGCNVTAVIKASDVILATSD